MADNGVNKGRRRFLVGATSVVGAVGAVGVAVPFVASWQPSASALAAGAPVRANFSKLEPGQRVTIEWRGRPVWIINRTPEMVERTESLDPSRLRDPESTEQQQPAYITGPLRSVRPEVGVMVGVCTHLGCSPLYRPEPEAAVTDNWPGGFFCPCHGSYFDLAGRVFNNVPAPSNLEVPPYRFEGEDIIVGEDEEAA
ncbi:MULTISPECIES: ubiquinol-cytochrome c reductase iron-sulfur subunit [Halomonadaceae]|uniref:Ubiquinol-cytochrome c reductase iron-sulfur subunit n=1 Tax=Vreelandella hamiltonii TaxID=502829 RepID=A0A8H9I2V8_9GAMM|nr:MULTISPECIES: ubiquinol-cytochrome c reductase iron-sulfur subunit [Halomonas]ATH79179.1 ubiquinol-cytochrome c reductase iron-sulfur subunit [Halomonas hydrothermalis]KHJ51798.1 ubiquinol-cytochrome C reductase [Halomonas hydrothermalis]UDM08662.1 ubiquinol-cytochrome c reductase iron-sulfur subunit [Halomonas sp. NyZ770]GGW21278.1 ubiquinol-cytochrome c reductase iron-sulfur subunit [Halomonas hamiltonii]